MDVDGFFFHKVPSLICFNVITCDLEMLYSGLLGVTSKHCLIPISVLKKILKVLTSKNVPFSFLHVFFFYTGQVPLPHNLQ